MVFRAATVIVHDLPQIHAVLSRSLPVILCSAPAAGLYMGCGWWARMLQLADFTGLSLLDCADAPGRALEALHEGLPGIILDCPAPAYEAVAEIAAAQGAVLCRAAPRALDMAARGAERLLDAWLKTEAAIL